MLEVAAADGVRVEVDAAEVHDPGQRRAVVEHDLVGRPAGREGELDGPNEVRDRLRRPLLEERLALGAVHEALERHGPVEDAAQRAIGDGEVVLDQLQLRDAGLGEIELGGVADLHLVAVEIEDLRFGACHRGKGTATLNRHRPCHGGDR